MNTEEYIDDYEYLYNVLDEIKQERSYQNSKWGKEFDNKNTGNDWVAYITRYLGKAQYFHKDDISAFRKNMTKVAALAVAAIEAYDRNNGLPDRHYDGE